jgi:glyoxylase-like metal-dependent hydrolase (beta-lactamase superfamily II)
MVFNYKPIMIDEFLADGQMLPLWGGLQVIYMLGHTVRHCGFFSKKFNLLFSGDMFASYFFNVHKPPAILNTVSEQLAVSAEKIRELKPRLVVPCHFDILDGELHRRRFVKLYGMDDWITSSSST